MFQQQRHELIMDYLSKKKSASVEALCKKAFCSAATMRRDLLELEKAGLIFRHRGGASTRTGTSSEYSYSYRNSEKQEEKAYICSIADNFITGGTSLFLDPSSTVFHLCTLLKKYDDLSVVTNGITTAYELARLECANLYVAGGSIGRNSASILGEFSNTFIDNFHADVAIFSCRGLDESSAYESSQEQALAKRRMLENSDTAILLCDSSKFHKSFFFKLADLSDIDVIITEKEPSAAFKEAAEKAGCEVLY